MDKENVEKIKNNKKIIEQVLNIPTELTHRNKTKNDLIKKKFEELIITLEQIDNRSCLLNSDFSLNLINFEEPYYIIINNLLELLYPIEIVNLIKYYVYGRMDENGKIIPLTDNEGGEIILNNPGELYSLIQQILNRK